MTKFSPRAPGGLQPAASDPDRPDARIRRVFLVFKSHLDLGFTGPAAEVRRRYLEEFFPRAIETAERLRGTPERFVWTTGAFILEEALRAAGGRRVERAVRAGELAWHAMPFTMHTELLDPGLLAFGLGISAGLDRRFGRVTRAAKVSDVPGHSCGAAPVLAAAGVRFMHVGVNGASTPPDVPVFFRYGPREGAEILVLYQSGGYGAAQAWPELGVALAFAHAGDNHGPPTAEQVRETHAEMRRRFPRARIEVGALEGFAGLLWPLRARLPAVRQEIGDTWIHGAGSDPWKVAAFRELSRLRAQWLVSGRGRRAALDRFSRALLCVPEHTWGLDVKEAIGTDPRYERRDFDRLRETPPARRIERSWREQRGYIAEAVSALGETELGREARERLAALRPDRAFLRRVARFCARPAARRVDAWAPFRAPHHVVAFDRATGALRQFATPDGGDFADARHLLGRVAFQLFSAADYDRFARQYLHLTKENRWWAIPDYCKPGLERVAGLRSRCYAPRVVGAAGIEGEGVVGRVFRLAMPREAVERYGAPAEWLLTWLFPAAEPVAELTLEWFDKPAGRIPCALWCSFAPRLGAGAGWLFDKVGEPVDPRRVVRNGNRRLHAVGQGVAGYDRAGTFQLDTLDAPLVAPGAPGLLDFHQRLPDARAGVHVNLYNNVWGTNFPLWYGEDARFRFRLRAGLRGARVEAGS
jgi:hypothetical protein